MTVVFVALVFHSLVCAHKISQMMTQRTLPTSHTSKRKILSSHSQSKIIFMSCLHHLEVLEQRSTPCSAFLVGICCCGEPLGLVSSVNDLWMFQYARPKCWITASSIYLGGAASWTEDDNMYPTKGWSEEKIKHEKGFSYQHTHPSRASITLLVRERKDSPERTHVREGWSVSPQGWLRSHGCQFLTHISIFQLCEF